MLCCVIILFHTVSDARPEEIFVFIMEITYFKGELTEKL